MSDSWLRSTTELVFEMCLMPAVGLVGMIGNTLSILVLQDGRGLELKRSFCLMLQLLSSYDLLLVVSFNMLYALPVICPDFHQAHMLSFTPFMLYVVHVAVFGCVYSVVAVAVERYCIICQPFSQNGTNSCFLNDDGGPKPAVVIVVVVALSLIYNASKLFELTTESSVLEQDLTLANLSVVTINTTRTKVLPTALRSSPLYTEALIGCNFVFTVLLPLTLMIVCHVATYRHIRASSAMLQGQSTSSRRRRRDVAMVVLFSIIVVIFVACNSGRVVLNIFEIIRLLMGFPVAEKWPLWTSVVSRISHLLLVMNSSANFFIYCFRDCRFREALLRLLCIKRMVDNTEDNSNDIPMHTMPTTEHNVR